MSLFQCRLIVAKSSFIDGCFSSQFPHESIQIKSTSGFATTQNCCEMRYPLQTIFDRLPNTPEP